MLKDFTKEEFDIIIQAGQSNSEGYGYGDVSEPFVPNDKIWYLNSNFTISLASEVVYGNYATGNFSLSFANEYIKKSMLHSGRKLLIIRAAVGGTGFCDHHWGVNDDLFLRMLEMAKTAVALNPKNKLVALLWHQGETDSGTSREVHFKNLEMLVKLTRNVLGCHSLPFIAGDFVQGWKAANIKSIQPVEMAIRDVCASIGNAFFVETDGLLSNHQQIEINDIIHFCRESLYILGEKYFDAFCKITKD